jgi:hypothetical protein
MFRTALYSNELMSSATKSSGQLVGDQARTVVGITSITSDGTCNLTVAVENTGATTITEFPMVDFILEFSLEINPPRRLIHSFSEPPALGEWAVASITGAFEPGSLNPGESMTLSAKISMIEASDGKLTIGTPNGIIDTALFPALTPC